MRKTPSLRPYPIPTRKYPPRQLIPVPPSRYAWYQVHPIAAFLALLALTALISLGLPALSTHDPFAMNLQARLQAPSLQHWLGTDQFGRDVFSRVLHGGRISLLTGLVAVIVALLPGLWLGLLAGYYGGWVDTFIGGLANVMLAFPGLLLALLIMACLGPDLGNAMLAIGITGIPKYIRLARSNTLQLRRSWFVRAAHIVGCTPARILTHHILPNIAGSVIALATLDIAWAILNTATLSFLGLGAQPPIPEWGTMINEGRAFLRPAPWISMAPGLTITLTVWIMNMLGDRLRYALDPRRSLL